MRDELYEHGGRWHVFYNAAYLYCLARMPDVQLLGLHDVDPQIVAHRAAAVCAATDRANAIR
jgi:hypothetical protein